ncbi:condensation domain-containing protein [Thermocatellispora tengchongensis]|uniref:condensation domain-containing protein n=1 Tax=Thermocatellispora tengchongensis TaxID=1073253 RepID=UPI003628894F
MNGSEPASLAQHGMWVTERAGLGGAVYHMAFAVHLDGPLDTYRMLAACGAVVRRHPVLAAALVERDGRLHMAPAAVPPKIGYEDLSDGGPALLPGSPEWLASPLSPGLDLSTGPVSAFTLVRLAPDLHTLLVVVHHAVCDGVSEELLLRDLAAAYGGAELPPLPVSYGEAASAETARVEDKLEEAARFWRSRWHDEEDVLLPGARRARLRAVPGEAVDLALGGGVAETAERLGVTRFEFTLAAFQVLLHAYGNERATVSIDVSTRTEQTREHVGLFVNELPVALTPSGTFAGFAHVVRRQLREVYRLREVPVARALGGISPRSALTPVSMSFRRVDDEIGFAGLDASVELSMFTGYVRGTLHLHALDSPTASPPGSSSTRRCWTVPPAR